MVELNSNLTTIFFLLMVGYAILYIGGRKYLENFECDNSLNPDRPLPELPYLSSPIDMLDDYEVSTVFKNQGSKEASKRQISDAMTRYPMDWSVQGPGSQYFQDNQENQKNKPLLSPAAEELLPDTKAMDEEERKILQTYKPESSKGLLQYSVDDVSTLLERVYSKKGLIPVLNKSKQGPNIWEITEVKEKNPTIVWEEDRSERNVMTQRGEEVIEVPYTATDMAAGLDPFFQGRRSVRDGKYDYTEFTPGLERMFAPTYPIKSWA